MSDDPPLSVMRFSGEAPVIVDGGGDVFTARQARAAVEAWQRAADAAEGHSTPETGRRPGEQITAARQAGRAAAQAGQPATSNPYHGTADDARERVLSVMWLRGYQGVTIGFPVDLTG